MGGGGSSGGGGGGTTQSVSNSYQSLSPWIAPYVTSMLGAGQQQVFQTDASGNITGMTPYNAYGSINPQTGQQYGINPSSMAAANASVAQFSPLQQQSFQGAQNLQTPGQFGQATNAAGMGTMQSLMAGQNLANQSTNPYAVGAYMNPYIQNALNPALQLSNQQYGIAGQQMAGQATGSGAFGGTRSALQQGLNAQNQMLAQNQLIGNAYNTAYQNAQNQMNTVANVGLQGANQGIAGAGQLANIGTGQLGAQQGIINQQNQLGQQGTAQQQAIINQAMQNYQTGQQYPFQQLTNLKNLLSGVPITDVTQSQQAAAPSTAQLIGSAGLTLGGIAAGANSGPAINIGTFGGGSAVPPAKEGGIMKLARGGSAIFNKVVNQPADVSAKEVDTSIKDGAIPKGIPAALAQAMQANAQQQAKMPAQAPTSTVIQDVDAKEQQAQGMDMQKLLAQYPTIMADLKVERDIAKEKGDKEAVREIDTKIREVSMLAQRAQEQMQMQPAQGPGPLSAPAPQGIEAAMPQQAQPQQMAQAQPQAQGIASFKEGGTVKRYVNDPTPTSDDTSKSAFMEDLSGISDWYNRKMRGSAEGIVKPMQDIKNYFTKPRQTPLTTADREDMESPAAIPRGQDATTQMANPDDLKPFATRTAPSAPADNRPSSTTGSKTTPVQNLDVYDVNKATNNITDMVKNFSNMIASQYNQDDSNKILSRALIGAGKGMATGVGRQAIANAIQGGGAGYEQAQDMSEARKDKLMTNYIAMGMSGLQLQMQAQKLGIDAADLKAKMPMYIADANYKNAMAGYVRSGKGQGGLGNLTGKDAAAMRNEVDTWLQKPNPTLNPTLWRELGQLPNGKLLQQKLSASPNSDLYQEGVKELNSGSFRTALMQGYILEPRIYSSKGSASGVSSLTGE
jgi:hypothetical protein